MNNKIPCGGFYLSDTLGVDDNGKLGVNGGEPYKSLVTDGDGGVKWEDRLAYDDRKLFLDLGEDAKLVKVADEVPSWASIDSSIKAWNDKGEKRTLSPEDYDDLGNGSFSAMDALLFIMTDNFELEGQIVPEKGVYFLFAPGEYYITGIASADSDTPDITWDGNVGTLKTIDQKFIPPQPLQVVYVKATGGNFTTTATGDYSNNTTLDKTYDEISALVSQGVDVKIVTPNNYVLNYAYFYKNEIDFSAYYPDDNNNQVAIRCTIHPDNSVEIFFYYLDCIYLRIDSDEALRDPLILHSSTPGSSKKFKITVDDSGSISATAV